MIEIFLFVVFLTVGVSGFDPESHRNWKLLPHDICGQAHSRRIIGGVEAPMNAYPWLALLGYKSPTRHKISFQCGGAVLNTKVILTAAHCVTDLDGSEVAVIRLGEHNIETNPDCKDGVCADPVLDISPSEIIIHKNYDNPILRHDIALIRLQKEIKFSAFVSPICLGGREFQKKNFLGTKADVAGWGIYDTTTNKASTKLLVVKLRVVENEICQKYLPANIQIGSTQLCVGGRIGADSCGGDSGGPLMKVDNGPRGPRYYILGVVSFGATKCGATKMPGVYTKVSDYMEWILNNLEKTSYNSIRVGP